MTNRDKILNLLIDGSEDWVSGEHISNLLGISRTAVWKNINILKEMGYSIDSSSKLGHKLISSHNVLNKREIQSKITTDILGCEIVYFEETDSTNIRAFEMAVSGAPQGTIVVADSQTMGKGRLSRKWFTDPGKGLALSMILRPGVQPLFAPRLTLLTAVALSKVLDRLGIGDYEIKWPNDILLKGKKVSGILSEMKADIDSIEFVIIGLGINLNTNSADLPEEIRYIACSLKEELGREISRAQFLAHFLESFEFLYLQFLSGDFSGILEQWIKKSKIINKKIKVTILEKEIFGTVSGVNEDGNLILITEQGEFIVNSGDINYI